MVGFSGVTAIETNFADVTVNVWDGLEIPPLVALISVVPNETDVANPELLMVATLELSDFQAAMDVMFLILPSE